MLICTCIAVLSAEGGSVTGSHLAKKKKKTCRKKKDGSKRLNTLTQSFYSLGYFWGNKAAKHLHANCASKAHLAFQGSIPVIYLKRWHPKSLYRQAMVMVSWIISLLYKYSFTYQMCYLGHVYLMLLKENLWRYLTVIKLHMTFKMWKYWYVYIFAILWLNILCIIFLIDLFQTICCKSTTEQNRWGQTEV